MANDRTLRDLAPRVLGGHVDRWLKGDRWSHRVKDGRYGPTYTRWSGTTPDLRAHLIDSAVAGVDVAAARTAEMRGRLEALPAELEARLAEVRAEFEGRADRARAELEKRRGDEAKARDPLAEVRKALGPGEGEAAR